MNRFLLSYVRSGIVAPPVSRPGHRLLWCLICRLDLAVGGDALVCANRHSFDLARGGHVNLLFGDRRRPAAGGDTAEQLRHRAAFHRDPARAQYRIRGVGRVA
jgi:23S rRNA (guanine745-N1)-methyltransferase